MKQERINYKDVIDLGFKVEECGDHVYFDQYGFEYCVITFDLTPTIYLDWEKETGMCKMVRVKNTETYEIMKELPIMNINHLKEIVDFFSDAKPFSLLAC